MTSALGEPIVIGPSEAAESAVESIGGKAAGLVRLESAGAMVPPWLVLPASVFASHLQRVRQKWPVDDDIALLGTIDPTTASGRVMLEAKAAEVRRAIELTPLSDDVDHALAVALSRVGGHGVALRSSMVGEDSAQHSFAGQFDSVLQVRGVIEARSAVLRCWSSAYTARSLTYRHRIGSAAGFPRMAVIIQRMVEASVSGVMFTANPVNGRADEALISSVRGLGDALVSGAADADEYVVRDDGTEIDVPAADRRTLSVAQLAQLHREGLRLAGILGEPLDLEWTLDGDTLYMLQARPITSIARHTMVAAPRPVQPAGHRIIWDNSNIQESYCGVTTPLTFSFASRAYASVYEQTMRVLGLPESTIAAHRPMLRNLLGLIRGRVYYNINNWYRGLLLLPSFGRNKADMERMMGLEEPADIVVDQVQSGWDRVRCLPRMAYTLVRLLGAIRGLRVSVPTFLEEFERRAAGFDRRALAEASIAELMQRAEWLRTRFIERWHTPIVNDFHVMMAAGRLRRIVQRAVGARTDALYHALLGGVEGLESSAPTHWLMRLADSARGSATLVQLLKQDRLPSIDELRRVHPAFAAELGRYIERYGDRCMGELKLETISHREDPTFLIRVIRNYLDHPALDAARLAESERVTRIAAEREVEGMCGPVDRWRFRRALRAARTGIRARESMRLARTRLFGMYRDTYRAVGARLHERGLLASARDIFYLTVEEVENWHEGTGVTSDLGGLAALRRREFTAFEADELPNRLETRDGVLVHESVAVDADARRRILRGTACCAGVVEARIRVVMSASDDLDIGGMILTTLRTDPGWAPLFPSAAGILVERGSTLSHSAVLARELGIPAVVGVPGLLKAVRDGERVRMDGTAGTVELLEGP